MPDGARQGRKEEIMAKVVLIDSKKKQYKANLHCHSVLSDGALTPEQLKEAYKAEGYSVLAITDHCRPCDHSAMSDESFLLLTGYEAYIRMTGGKYDMYLPEVHLNLFSKEPHNLSYICYNPSYCKYLPKQEHTALNKVGSERPREYSVEYVNEFIETARENGYIVAYNHPFWSMESEEQILSYKGLFSLEIFNTGSYKLNHLENAEMLYDRMLRMGMHIGCHGADDNHNRHPFGTPDCDSFGGFTVILADRLEYSEIIGALEKNECYASTGPRIYGMTVYDGEDGKHVRVECSEASAVHLFFGGKKVFAVYGEDMTEADFLIPEGAKFLRVTVWDKNERSALTRGYFPEEWA